MAEDTGPQGIVFMLVRDGMILMERCPKKAARHGGEWFIPGGRIEAGEDVFEALDREMGEEIGCVSLAAGEMEPVDAGVPGAPFLVVPFYVGAWKGDVPDFCLDHPDVPLRWMSLAEVAASPVSVIREMVSPLLSLGI